VPTKGNVQCVEVGLGAHPVVLSSGEGRA